ncbi:hypothetical protein K474DRAFT_1678297 [Panus rudis PR-1116 ss-1]|nr:hypothetical protein K474DRAFT_1678297 [Panus rudis PR-1116 ss-1]
MRFSLLAITASSVAYCSIFAVPVWNDGVDVSQTSGLHPPSDLIPYTDSIEDEHSLRYNMHTLKKQRSARPSNAAPPSSQGAHAPYPGPGTHHHPEPTSHGGGPRYTFPQWGGRTRQPSMSQQIMQPGHSQQQQRPSLPAPASFQSTTGWQPVMAPGSDPCRLGGGIPQMHPAPVMPQSFSGRQPVIPPGLNTQRGPVVPVHIASTAPLQQHAYGGPVIPTDHDFIGSSSKNKSKSKSKAKGKSKFW